MTFYLLNCRFSEGRAMLNFFLYSVFIVQVLITDRCLVDVCGRRGGNMRERKEKAGKEGMEGPRREGRIW